MLASILIISGCSTTERLVAERVEPAGAELPATAQRVGLAPFEGEGGIDLTQRVQDALAAQLQVEAFRVDVGDERPLSTQGAQLLVAEQGLDVLLHGRVEMLEGPGDEAVEAPARLRVRYQLVLGRGVTRAAPILAVTLSYADHSRSERGWRDAILSRAADELVATLRRRTVPTEVEWEFAEGWDEDAWERFAAGDHAAAEVLLRAATGKAQEAGAGAEALAALYYDLALCQELQGAWSQAERSYDEALTLAGSELHLVALRSLRERIRRAGGAR